MTQHIQLFPCSRRTPRPFHRARREWKMKLFQSQLREMGLSRCFRPKLESIETCGATMLVWVVGSQTLSFACTPCLKGHRSNSCAHYERPLVEVKGKGRPVSQCGHCRTRRSGGLSLALSTGGDVVGADVLGSNPDTATPTSSSPSCSVSSKKPRGHSHHKCLCGLEAAARARRSVDAAFSVYTRKGRTPVSLSFSTTEHTLFQATLEASRTSKMLIQTVRRKDKAAHASTTLSPTLFPAATAPIPRLLTPPTVSSSSSTSVPAVPSTTTDGPIATAPPDLQQQQVETDTADFILHFERMSVSTPESLSLTFVNPCSCAFGNPCICGDLSLKKAKQAVAAAAPSHQHASETTPSLNLLRPVLPSFSTILNRGGSGVAAASSRTGAASLLPGVAALTSGLLAAPFDAPRLASCCGAGKPPVSVVPVADSAGTAARGTQDAAFVAQALLGLKEGPAGASAASLFSCSSSSLSSSDCMQECNIGDEEGNCGEEDEDAGGCGCGCSCVQESVLSSTGGGCCATKPVDEMVIGSPRAGCGSGGPDGGGSGCRC